VTPATGRRPRIAGLAFGAAFAALTGCVAVGQPFGALDRAVNTAAHHATVAHPVLLAAARSVTLLGGAAVLTALVVLAAALLARTERRRAVAVLTLTAGAALAHSLLKVLIGRPRPTFADPLVHLASQAFPSGHATNSTVVYGTLLLLTLPRIGPAARRRLLTLAVAVLVVGVAASRVLLGAHWLTDVVGGLLLSITWLALFFPAATRSASSTQNGRSAASAGAPSSAQVQPAAQRTAPSPFAVTARPDPGATGAVIRRVRLGWHQAGQDWRYADVSRDQWEIVCRDCGDDEGPPQRQTADVSLLRRPIVGPTRAQTALQHHLKAHRQTNPQRAGRSQIGCREPALTRRSEPRQLDW